MPDHHSLTTNQDGSFTLDGVRYWGMPDRIEISGDGVALIFSGFVPVNRCDCCGRFDTAPRVANSWQEAIDLGYVIPATPGEGEPRVGHHP